MLIHRPSCMCAAAGAPSTPPSEEFFLLMALCDITVGLISLYGRESL